MASIVEKYQQIFAADPRSRIFVELARALLERGEPERAIEVCRTGLDHHPSSIQGRVIWGRSLLAQGDLPGAQDQFEIAIALDPASPYAFNLVGEGDDTEGDPDREVAFECGHGQPGCVSAVRSFVKLPAQCVRSRAGGVAS